MRADLSGDARTETACDKCGAPCGGNCRDTRTGRPFALIVHRERIQALLRARDYAALKETPK